jgi:hypothetical protein
MNVGSHCLLEPKTPPAGSSADYNVSIYNVVTDCGVAASIAVAGGIQTVKIEP